MAKILCVALVLGAGAPAPDAEQYGFTWWADGWRGRSADGQRVLCIQTSQYGMALDVEGPAVLHLGALNQSLPYAEAVSASNDAVLQLPAVPLDPWAEVAGKRFRCVASARDTSDMAAYPVRLIESGRYLQRVDIQQLEFRDEEGKRLPAAGRLEIVSWPDRLGLVLELTPERDLTGLAAGVILGDQQARQSWAASSAGAPRQLGLTWFPGPADAPALPTVAVAREAEGGPLPVTYDPLRGWHYIDLPEEHWNIAAEPGRVQRFTVSLRNEGDATRSARLLFAFDEPFAGVTGMSPMLLDAEGRPTGIPVQISKNWHRLPDRRFLYEGPWFHGAAVVELAPGQTWTGCLQIVYDHWGGLPAVSHAQLCLVGWGTNQRWDQVAIGSWGESITYDPDVNLNRSMIDDVRPLMVRGMQDGGPWQWTANVGGGDFLVYHDPQGRRQYLSRMRAAYLQYGPNLTKAVYAGITPDGCLEARIEVSSPRCDDVNRAFHRFRYDVRKPMAFSRLAFYQLGADHYNDHQFTTLGRGNADGLVEEWEAPRGGNTYHRTGIACEGRAPWFSLHGGQRNAHHPKGAWANRGLVIRSWKARLGGVDVPRPIAAVYGTENGVPSANVELVPPEGCTQLLPGDFVEAEAELLIVPMRAEDYYGPNEALRADLTKHADTWRPVHRLARANDLRVEVEAGALIRAYPVVVQAADDTAACRVLGGAGYVPVTFQGLSARTGYTLEGADPEADQYVQVDFDGACNAWSRTYNISLDGAGPKGRRLRLVRQAGTP